MEDRNGHKINEYGQLVFDKRCKECTEKACNCDPLWQHDGEKVTLLHANHCASNPKPEYDRIKEQSRKIMDDIYNKGDGEFSGATVEQHHEHGTEAGGKEFQELCEKGYFDNKYTGKANYSRIRIYAADLILKTKEEGHIAGQNDKENNEKFFERGKKEGYQKRDKEVDVSAVFGFDAGVKSERERILAALFKWFETARTDNDHEFITQLRAAIEQKEE